MKWVSYTGPQGISTETHLDINTETPDPIKDIKRYNLKSNYSSIVGPIKVFFLTEKP